MALNLNVDPYYDDFSGEKNYHRILFKPGSAVQARELTQAQTILQDQITKFADNIFKQNSPVSGGQVTTNLNCNYIKLQTTYNNSAVNVLNFNGKLVRNSTGTVVAQVITVAAATGADAPTLILSYKTGTQFSDGDVIYVVDSPTTQAQLITTSATGSSSVASIAQGVFYVLGNFVQVSPSTTILSKYDNVPSKRVGLTISESIVDYTSDSSLLDPALGATNYQAPGADRYQISLTLDTRPLSFGDDSDFIELVRIENGIIGKQVDGSVYNVIDDYFAKRDYETNGDYIVTDFTLTPKTSADSTKYTMSIGPGVAYVHGYRIENLASVDLTSNRAKTIGTTNTNSVYIDTGSYFYVNTLRGAAGDFFHTTESQVIDLHCVTAANANLVNAASYSSTLVASGYIRNIVYDHVGGSDYSPNTYIYRAYVNDLQLNAPTGTVAAATANTVQFPGTFSAANNAYVGVNMSILSGTDAGDFRTITAYNGVTRTATVNQNFTVTPDTSSVFVLNFDIKDGETVVATSTPTNALAYPATLYASAVIDNSSKVGGVSTGATFLSNPTMPEMIFRLGNPYANNITNPVYTTQTLSKGVVFSSPLSLSYSSVTGGTNVLKHIGTPSSTLSSDLVKQNFTIIVTAKGATSYNVGDLIPFSTVGTVALDSTGYTATLTSASLNGATVDILEKVQADGSSVYVSKTKTLVSGSTSVATGTSGTLANTGVYVDVTNGQTYIQKGSLVTPGQKQSLYVSDVKSIVKIYDTGAIGTAPSLPLSQFTDVTNNYSFDNGQRDGFYDHASITLKPGSPQPGGNLLVVYNFYSHSGGDGYFSLASYTNEPYQQIPQYISADGDVYNLRDCIDFRPARLNAQSSFVFRYNISSGTYKGVMIPTDLTTFTSQYSYYLGRKDKLVLSKDKSFKIIEGAPSLTPIFPNEPDGSLVIAQLSHNPYTGYIPTEAPSGYIPDLSISKVKHKRYTMEDIAGLEERINQVQYYTSLSLLEQKAQNLQTPDAYGLNRFKNGILVDDFSSFATADTFNLDFNATINRRERILTSSQQVNNYPLKSLATVYNMASLANTVNNGSLGYAVSGDGLVNYYSLPYTTANVISQKFASRQVNVNPFSFTDKLGSVYLTPNVDNWVDTNYSPALLITDPNLQVFRASNTVNVMTAGDWQTIPGTTYTTSVNTEGHGVNPSPYGNVGYTTTTLYGSQVQNNIMGAYDKIGNTYALNNNYITDISVLPFIRQQQVVTRAKGLLQKTTVKPFFDGTDVTNYFRNANIIELTSVSGSFQEDDVVGYYTGGVFYPTARVLGVYVYPGTTNVRLYVAADGTTTRYSSSTTLQNAYYDQNGTYVNSSASGTINSTTNRGGQITNNLPTLSTFFQLAPTANTNLTGNTLYITSGTGVGQSATITNYFTANQVAVLSSSISCANGDIYSVGTTSTDESGSAYGVFCIPPNLFHTGQRVFRFDNSIGGNPGTATTAGEATYYAQGLQTQAQAVNFGASPAGAKGTFTQSNYANNTILSVTISPWDPVAQTFIVSKDNYPNGIFLDSVKFFFASKPANDSSPINLSIVGTQNGYPNGQTLDHSIVSLTPDKVNVNASSPQYLDPASSTVFKFNSPVYIQPGVLYSFLLKSNSNEYNLWSASNGDTALASSTKNYPTDVTPSTITKIGSSPYVGALFISQNSQTWTADQNQSLMFVADQCVFNTSAAPAIPFVVPKRLPQRTFVDQSINATLNANTILTSIDSGTSNTDVLVDAFNVATTDFLPTTTGINYSYNATLVGGSAAGITNINPGKYGTPMSDNIYLNDNKGERVLQANSNTSFTLYTTLTTTDPYVSPIVSDAGLSVYAVKWNINNCELSNSLITMANTGTGYNAAAVTVSVSSPLGFGGVQATAAANVVGGVIRSIYFTNPGSGYITTPTITITDAATRAANVNAVAYITGESSPTGGPALTKYFTKKVVLEAGYDAGDLNVFMTAYRPYNTDINVYYKIENRNDTQKFEDGQWQLMTKTNSSNSVYSLTRSDLHEYSFAPGAFTSGTANGYVTYTSTNGQTYTSFSQFAIKVVMTTTDKTFVPFATDLRVLALPPTINTTV